MKHECPKCQRKMEEGHLPDLTHGSIVVGTWAPGIPVPRRFIGGISYKKKEQTPIVAYRCSRCGYVELYAGEP